MHLRARKRGRQRSHARSLSEPLESRLLLTTYPVSTTADTGAGSLRQAILSANGHVGLDTITFAIAGTGVHVISPASALPSITDPVVINGTTQSGYSGTPLIEIKGSSAGNGVDGLALIGGGTTVNGLIISNFDGSGISMYNSLGTNLVENCYLGTDPTGTIAAPNFYDGIQISGGSANNQITNNLISGNGTDPTSQSPGISIFGAGTNSNIISGNKIGTDITGTQSLGNSGGIIISTASISNTISGNLISANGLTDQYPGIQIWGTGTNSNVVIGNKIGTDITGTLPLGNGGVGVLINDGAQSNRVGTNGDGVNDAAERNIISANGLGVDFPGLEIADPGSTGNIVAGNYIGTDVTGTQPLGNGGQGVSLGNGAQLNRIGINSSDTDAAAERNIISANGFPDLYPGIEIFGTDTDQNVVAGNYIGTDVTGTQPLGNAGTGVAIDAGSQDNTIGTNGDGVGDALERNIISDNGAGVNYAAVAITGTNADGNIVAGNYLGTDVTGTQALGNGGQGVFIAYGAQSNRIGVNSADADPAGERNIIAANGFPNYWPGIQLYGSDTNSNVVAGNYIGVDVTGLVAMGNEGVGIIINGGAENNRIGTNGDGVDDSLERNIIANSGYQGIYIADTGTIGNVVAGNYVGANASDSPQGNDNNGIWIDNGASGNRIGTNGTDIDAAGEGNLIIANAYNGVIVSDPTTGTDHSTGNSIRGNSIHDNGAGYVGINLGGDFNLNHGTAIEPGPNNFENYPTLTSGTPGASTTVTGVYTGPASTVETLDFYASSTADGPFDGTGDRWLGSITINSGATGTVTFTASARTAASGERITATATDPSGNSSEFSPPIQLPAVQLQTNAGSWTPIGPAPIMESNSNAPVVSGRVVVATPDPTNQNVMYIATDGGGIWKTTDWLDTVPQWTPLTDNMPSDQVGNNAYTPLAVAGSNAQILYAAVSGPGGGILKSANGGASWTELANSTFDLASFASIVIDPTNANNVYVSVWYGATGGGGVYKSTDGGNTWTNTTSSIHDGSAADLVMDPANPSILYTGLVGDTTSGGAHNGIYESINGGSTWTLQTNGVLSGSAVGASIRLAISPSSPSVLYATVFDPALGNAPDGEPHRYKTTNGGTSWSAISSLPSGDEFRYWHALLSIDPHNANIVYVNGDHTLFQSSDGGTTWTQIYEEDPVNVTFDDTGAVVETGDRGIYRWTGGTVPFLNKQGNLGDVEFYSITLAPNDPLTVYGIAQDQLDGLKTSDSPVWTYMGGADEVGRVVVDPSNPNTLYEFDPNNGGTASNSDAALPAPGPTLYFVWKSTDGGANWTPANAGIPTTNVGYNLAYTSQRAFVMDPTNDSRLLLGLDQVYETTDAGSSWAPISPVLSAGQFISSIAIAPSAPNTVYAATGDGKLFVTSNDSTWTERDTGLPLNYYGHVMDMQVDPANSLHAFVVCGSFLGGDTSSDHVFVTTNGGVSWTNITGNLPPEDAGQALAVDWRFATPRLYIGTLRGVFLSTDLGAHWSAFGANMPNTIVTDLEMSTTFNVLAAATYGRGAFEMRIPATTSDVITGTSLSDSITLVQDFDHVHIDWTLGNSSGQILIADAAGLTINGNGGNDLITLSYINGDPLPNKLNLNGIFTLNGLATTGNPLANTTLDIKTSTVYIPYSAPASDPISLIQGYLKTGYNTGSWTGTSAAGSIRSSAAAAAPLLDSIGYADSADTANPAGLPANTIELRYTVIGDTNLDGTVGLQDLAALLKSYGSGTKWDQGLLDYGTSVGLTDLAALLKHYGQTASSPSALPSLPPAAGPAAASVTMPTLSSALLPTDTTGDEKSAKKTPKTKSKVTVVATPSKKGKMKSD